MVRTHGNYSHAHLKTTGSGSKDKALGARASLGFDGMRGSGSRGLCMEPGQMILILNGTESTLSDFCDDDLRRAVFNSLFSWARASDSDDLPGDSRQGWWGDTYSDIDGDQFGSKLWLLARSKLTEKTLQDAKTYAEDALQWMVDDGIATSVTVETERGGAGQLNLGVTIQKPDEKELLGMRFQDIWG